MLDLDRLLIDAENLNTVSHGTSLPPQWDKGRVPCETQQPCGLAARFRCVGQVGQGFSIGACREHLNSCETYPLPRAPFAEEKNSRPEKGKNPCPACPTYFFLKNSECLCGFPSDFDGTRALSRACPACPALSPADLEARIERAAIMEYDGGLTRAAAEMAAGLVRGSFPAFPLAGPFELVVFLG